jgi:asparagine synthase (glutamine-hydrolysing)
VGFTVPLDQWFRSGLKDLAHDLLLSRDSFVASYFDRAPTERLLADHQRGRRNEEMRLWTLLGLEIWHRTFLRGNQDSFIDAAPAGVGGTSRV